MVVYDFVLRKVSIYVGLLGLVVGFCVALYRARKWGNSSLCLLGMQGSCYSTSSLLIWMAKADRLSID